jgi:3-dehydroquinate dehydratase
MTNFILLKDGTQLEVTVEQKERINAAIMSTHDFEKIEVKLNGRYFKLGDMENDPKKIYKAAGIPLPPGHEDEETT